MEDCGDKGGDKVWGSKSQLRPTWRKRVRNPCENTGKQCPGFRRKCLASGFQGRGWDMFCVFGPLSLWHPRGHPALCVSYLCQLSCATVGIEEEVE